MLMVGNIHDTRIVRRNITSTGVQATEAIVVIHDIRHYTRTDQMVLLYKVIVFTKVVAVMLVSMITTTPMIVMAVLVVMSLQFTIIWIMIVGRVTVGVVSSEAIAANSRCLTVIVVGSALLFDFIR